jgi:hypothetical protein
VVKGRTDSEFDGYGDNIRRVLLRVYALRGFPVEFQQMQGVVFVDCHPRVVEIEQLKRGQRGVRLHSLMAKIYKSRGVTRGLTCQIIKVELGLEWLD